MQDNQRLTLIRDVVAANPTSLNMTGYRWGTTHCIAGYACMLYPAQYNDRSFDNAWSGTVDQAQAIVDFTNRRLLLCDIPADLLKSFNQEFALFS